MNELYRNRPVMPNVIFDNRERFFPAFGLFPLVVGGVLGGAIVSVTRPRPIIAYPTYGGYPPNQGIPYGFGSGYNYSSYGHYPY